MRTGIVLTLILVAAQSPPCLADGYEIGDAIFNDLYLFFNYNHAGLIYMAVPDYSDPERMPIIKVIEATKTSNVTKNSLDDFGMLYGPYRSLAGFSERQTAIELARQCQGIPYVVGGPTPDTFDALVPSSSPWGGSYDQISEIRCDGLVQYCYNHAGALAFYWIDDMSIINYGIHTDDMLDYYNNLPPVLNPQDPCYFFPLSLRGGAGACSGFNVGPGSIWHGAGTDLAYALGDLNDTYVRYITTTSEGTDMMYITTEDNSSGIAYLRINTEESDDPDGPPPSPEGDWIAWDVKSLPTQLEQTTTHEFPATIKGWYYLQAVDGAGNLSDLVQYYYSPTFEDFDETEPPPAAWIEDMIFRGGILSWHASFEDGTDSYRVLIRDGGRWVIFEDRIPARGSGSDYSFHVGTQWDTVALEEVEIKEGIVSIHEMGWLADADDSPHSIYPELPEIIIIGDERTSKIDSYISDKRSYGFRASFQQESSITEIRLRELQEEKSPAIVIPWDLKPASTSSMKTNDSSPSVLLIAPDLGSQTQNKLEAYKNEMTWNGIPPSNIRTFILPAPYDSTLIATEVIGCLEEYILIFGFASKRNDSQHTTTPLPWILNPDMTHIWDPYNLIDDDALSLWDYEMEPAVDTVRKCVGFLPVLYVEDIDLYNQKMMLAYQMPAYSYDKDIGTWRGNFIGYGPDPIAVNWSIDQISNNLSSDWIIDNISGAAYGANNPELEATALTSLEYGRSIVFMMATGSSYHEYGNMFSPSDYSSLYGSGKVTHMVSQSCETNEADPSPKANLEDYYGNNVVVDLLRVPAGGAISSVGPTVSFRQAYYYHYSKEYFDALEAAYGSSDGFIRIGDLHRRARNNVLDSNPTDTLALHHAKVNILLGDPTVPVYNDDPNPYVTVENAADRLPIFKEAFLGSACPNPFNPKTSIPFFIPRESNVHITIYDVMGRKVKTLIETRLEAGHNEVVWDGKNESGLAVGSGIYYYRFKTGGYVDTKRMILIR